MERTGLSGECIAIGGLSQRDSDRVGLPQGGSDRVGLSQRDSDQVGLPQCAVTRDRADELKHGVKGRRFCVMNLLACV